MIKSYADKVTAAVAAGATPKGFPSDLIARAKRKLAIVDAATTLADRQSPSGNRLEALAGDRAGQHSIRVNDQFRLCFRWHEGDAYETEIVDYH